MPLKAGVVQFSPLYGMVNDNLARLEQLIADGVSQGAQLLVLPEMAWTGYLWSAADAVRSVAEQARVGLSHQRLQTWSMQQEVALVFGFPEVSGQSLFNSQGFVTPDGTAHKVYRKTHLFEADTWWASPGDTGYLQWTWKELVLGSGICMDLNYRDLPAFHNSMNTQILCFSTNWLDQGFDVVPYWEEKLVGNESAYRGWALFANRGGQEFGVTFRGQSSIFFQGRRVAGLDGTKDGVLVVELETSVRKPT